VVLFVLPVELFLGLLLPAALVVLVFSALLVAQLEQALALFLFSIFVFSFFITA